MSHLVPGIDLPDRPIIAIRDDTEAEARRISGPARREELIKRAWLTCPASFNKGIGTSEQATLCYAALTGRLSVPVNESDTERGWNESRFVLGADPGKGSARREVPAHECLAHPDGAR